MAWFWAFLLNLKLGCGNPLLSTPAQSQAAAAASTLIGTSVRFYCFGYRVCLMHTAPECMAPGCQPFAGTPIACMSCCRQAACFVHSCPPPRCAACAVWCAPTWQPSQPLPAAPALSVIMHDSIIATSLSIFWLCPDCMCPFPCSPPPTPHSRSYPPPPCAACVAWCAPIWQPFQPLQAAACCSSWLEKESTPQAQPGCTNCSAAWNRNYPLLKPYLPYNSFQLSKNFTPGPRKSSQ